MKNFIFKKNVPDLNAARSTVDVNIGKMIFSFFVPTVLRLSGLFLLCFSPAAGQPLTLSENDFSVYPASYNPGLSGSPVPDSLHISFPQTRVIAHRGYWDTEGSAQNSIAALKKAQALHIYGSEFDVNRTLDGILVVAHGPMEQGVELQKVNYTDLSGIKLKNGERIPLLKEYLRCGKKDKRTRLILELKTHDSPQTESMAVREIVMMIKKYGLEKQVDFISFSLHACREFVRLMPGSNVAYLDGKYSPVELKEMGINGLDYHYSWFEKHPGWVEQARRLGMSVNVWTVSTREQLQHMIDLGVDFLTTNDPVLAKELLKVRRTLR